ncbi:MAG: hypothetical protein H0W89_00050 [Candidatus Levybacteria bacterium]|nr:hypothetical protein [Candidatus Levybacteria bacterium]
MEKYKKIVLLDIDDTIFNTAKFYSTNFKTYEMYEEVHAALKALSQIATLGIFSQGDVAFQKKKLVETNIDHLFQEKHTYIVEEKIQVIKGLIETYKDSGRLFVVEDRLEVLEKVKAYGENVFTIFMKRGRFAQNPRVVVAYKPDATVTDLHQTISLIENN